MLVKEYYCDKCGKGFTPMEDIFNLFVASWDGKDTKVIPAPKDWKLHLCGKCVQDIYDYIFREHLNSVDGDNTVTLTQDAGATCADCSNEAIWKEVELPNYEKETLELPFSKKEQPKSKGIVSKVDEDEDENELYESVANLSRALKQFNNELSSNTSNIEQSVGYKLSNALGNLKLSELNEDFIDQKIDSFLKQVTPEEENYLKKVVENGELSNFVLKILNML